MRKLGKIPRDEWSLSPMAGAVAMVVRGTEMSPHGTSSSNIAARTLTVGLLMGMAIGTGVAQAQTAPVPAASEPVASPTVKAANPAKTDEDSATELSTVTITAEKRLSRAIDVPSSVAAISGKKLLEESKTTLSDYLSGTPGVTVNTSGATKNNVTVRGVTTGGVGNPTVSVLIDDVPAHGATSTAEGGSLLPTLDPVDLRDIEVLRGPQSTLYGASSMGGLVKYSTIDPDTTRLGGMFQIDGSYVKKGGWGYTERAAVNVPLANDFGAIRLSAYNRRDPGYTTNVSDGETNTGDATNQGQRLVGLFYPNDRVTVRTQILHQKINQIGLRSESSAINGDPTYGDNTNSRIPGADYQKREFTMFTNTVTVDMDWAKFNSTTGYSDGSYGLGLDMSPSFETIAKYALGVSGYGAILGQTNYTHKWSQEFRLESPKDGRKLDWRLGAFYTQERSNVSQAITFANETTGALLDGGTLEDVREGSTYHEGALFGSTRYHFTPKFDVEVGLRYARNRQSFHEQDVADDSVSTGTSGEGVFSYSLAPRYHVSKNWMVYARIANGYRPGGANIGVSSSSPKTYGADKSVNYELGTKAEFLHKRLSTELSVYHITWKNIQLQAVDPTTSVGYYVNSGGAKSDGVETAVSAVPWHGMKMTASVGLQRAVLTEDAPDSIYGVKGDALPESSKWNGSLTARQTYPMGNGFKGFTAGTLTYVGKRTQDFTPDSDTPRLKLPAYTTLDLQTGASKDGWTLVAYVRNLFNNRGYTAASYLDQVNYSAVYSRSLILPRTIGLSLEKQF